LSGRDLIVELQARAVRNWTRQRRRGQAIRSKVALGGGAIFTRPRLFLVPLVFRLLDLALL
jgi:hypothetical protein